MDADAPARIPPHEIAKLLQRLIAANVDCARCFSKSAEQVRSTTLRHAFLNESGSREEFSRELQTEVRALGGEPQESGTALGDLHRWWLGVRGSLAGGDEYPVLAEVERSERAVLALYEAALKEPVGGRLQAVLSRHQDSIRRTCDTVAGLRRTAALA